MSLFLCPRWRNKSDLFIFIYLTDLHLITADINTRLAIWCSFIISMQRAPTVSILSLINSTSQLPFYSSSSTHHSKSIHLSSLSTSYPMPLAAPYLQHRWYNHSFICRHCVSFIPNSLLLSAHFRAPHTLYLLYILCTTTLSNPPSAATPLPR